MANEELRQLFERDQEGRGGRLSPWRALRLLWEDRDRRRRLFHPGCNRTLRDRPGGRLANCKTVARNCYAGSNPDPTTQI